MFEIQNFKQFNQKPHLNPGVLSVDFSFRGAFTGSGGLVVEFARERTSTRGRSVVAAEGGRSGMCFSNCAHFNPERALIHRAHR